MKYGRFVHNRNNQKVEEVYSVKNNTIWQRYEAIRQEAHDSIDAIAQILAKRRDAEFAEELLRMRAGYMQIADIAESRMMCVATSGSEAREQAKALASQLENMQQIHKQVYQKYLS